MTCGGCTGCSFDRRDATVSELAKHYGKLPYELHVTIERANIHHFRSVCVGLDIKPLLIDMQANSGKLILQDLMTSSKFEGDDAGVMAEMDRLVTGLGYAGYNITRQKIEAAPWHPDAPSDENGKSFQPGQYFESHLAITHNDKQRAYLSEFAKLSGNHLSKNAFKMIDGNTDVTMMTLRATDGTIETFKQRTGLTAQTLRDYGFVIEKEIIEFAWFDTNVLHDAAWTGAITPDQRLPS